GKWQEDGLHLNLGAGVFTDATITNLPVVTSYTNAVGLGDLDEDGDLDALLGDSIQNRLDLNLGAGVFANATATDLPAVSQATTGIALGDLDGDGDLDAFPGIEQAQGRLYVNLTRQLAWRGIPRAGKTLVLDLRGPAFGGWQLAAATGTASIPIPPFGVLRLDPGTLFAVAVGPFDPQGRASYSIQVPPIPALVGASAYWQAIVGLPLALTNLEITTVTGL
ncbi:MAG TPA: FG-GAP-like repeat-containing protein, partial [Planctomycetota bacterium]|nr:FG-GAP-like repeat-containing protein [Planctomycetota bacterium]